MDFETLTNPDTQMENGDGRDTSPDDTTAAGTDATAAAGVLTSAGSSDADVEGAAADGTGNATDQLPAKRKRVKLFSLTDLQKPGKATHCWWAWWGMVGCQRHSRTQAVC